MPITKGYKKVEKQIFKGKPVKLDKKKKVMPFGNFKGLNKI